MFDLKTRLSLEHFWPENKLKFYPEIMIGCTVTLFTGLNCQ